MPPDPELYRQIVESLPVGVYIVGLDRRIVFWNKVAEEITGYLSQEVIGRTCHGDVLVHCGARGTPVCASAGCLLSCALRDRKSIEAVLFARHKDGHRIPVFVRSIPLRDGEGKIVAIAELFQTQEGHSELRRANEGGTPSPDGLHVPSIIVTETYVTSKLNSPEGLAVFLVELLNRPVMAKQRGWEMVHTMTRTMVHTVVDILPTPHFVGRWRGDRFLIVVPGLTEECFRTLREELEGVSNSCSVSWWGDRVTLEVRVTGSLLRGDDCMETLLSRIDPAAANEPGR